MTTQTTRVAVNGYGVIGKRISDAVRAQPDMELVGVSDVATDYRVKAADMLGLRVFASLPEKVAEMRAAEIPVAGSLDDLLNQAGFTPAEAQTIRRRLVACCTQRTQ